MKKEKLIHRTVKYTISDVYLSFWMALQSNPALDKTVQKSLIVHQKLRVYKSVKPPNKHQNVIPENLVIHVYRK